MMILNDMVATSTLKGLMGSMFDLYTNFYDLHQVFKSSFSDIFMGLKIYLVFTSCQGENKYTHM